MMEIKEEKWLFKKYFLTAGKGESEVSKMNAFDKALLEAGIGHCNLVSVSSIIPKGAIEVKNGNIPAGSITFVVLSRMDGEEEQLITAGIGVAKCEEYGLVAEAYGFKTEEEILKEIRDKLYAMASTRNFEVLEIKTKVESMVVPKGKYGSVVAAVVFSP